MKFLQRHRLKLTVLLMAVFALTACSRNFSVVIKNHSEKTLSNVVVSGYGFSDWVGTIGPGAERTLNLRPASATPLRLGFDVGWRHVDTGKHGFYEPEHSSRVTLVIESDLRVSTFSESRKF